VRTLSLTLLLLSSIGAALWPHTMVLCDEQGVGVVMELAGAGCCTGDKSPVPVVGNDCGACSDHFAPLVFVSRRTPLVPDPSGRVFPIPQLPSSDANSATAQGEATCGAPQWPSDASGSASGDIVLRV